MREPGEEDMAEDTAEERGSSGEGEQDRTNKTPKTHASVVAKKDIREASVTTKTRFAICVGKQAMSKRYAG